MLTYSLVSTLACLLRGLTHADISSIVGCFGSGELLGEGRKRLSLVLEGILLLLNRTIETVDLAIESRYVVQHCFGGLVNAVR